MAAPVYDLSLIPLETLIKEIESRCPTFLAAFTTLGSDRKEIDTFFFGKGGRAKSVQLSADLHNDVLNNWNGEMQTLQRINNEGIL